MSAERSRPVALGGSALLFIALLGGCAGVPAKPAPEPAVAKQEKPAAPEVVASPLDPREEKRLAKELVRSVDEYHRLLQEKNVEKAAKYVEPEKREKFQDSLWDLVARYKIESADVASYQLFSQADGVSANVKVMRTVFERNSVAPTRMEHWMNWVYRDNRWILLPQQKQ